MFEKNIKQIWGALINLVSNIKIKIKKHLFWELKIDNEFRSFEANNQELHFKRFFLENIFGDFFTLKVKRKHK